MNVTIKKHPESRVEITVVIDAEKLMSYKDVALAELQKNIKVDGFRPGTAPSALVEKQVGDKLLDEMASLTLAEAYPVILQDHKIEAIGRPQIIITKLAMENPLEATIWTDVMPTVKLADVKKIAKDVFGTIPAVTVTDEEMQQAIKELRQMRAHQNMHDEGVDHHDHDHNNITDESLPEYNDEFVKTLGKFTTVAEFEVKLRENMQSEKEAREAEKKRVEAIDRIATESTIEIPALLVDMELQQMLAQFGHDLSMAGTSMDEYLKQIGKSQEEFSAAWKEQARKRAISKLVLDTISTEHKIVPTEEEINAEVTKVMDMYGDDPNISEPQVRGYVTQVLTHTKTFAWIESQK